MGLLIEGKWHDKWYDTTKTGGKFEREESQFRNSISPDGPFTPDAGRYHLYVSLACPWAHRALVMRKLKGLEPHIGVSVVSPHMHEHGWTFDTTTGSDGDPLYEMEFLHQLYSRHKADYTGRVTVPVLWDKQTEQIVNNESSEIIRIFNSAFNELTGNHADFYPQPLRDEINRVNQRVYDTINNGVYKAGFATTQEAYEQAYDELFASLDWLEGLLDNQRYLVGNQLTEADIRLFTTLIRFDAVYHGHFKCNRQRLEDFPNLSAYLRDIYQEPGVAYTVDFGHIKTHYYASHLNINPTGIVPRGPVIDYTRPHNRDRF